MTLRLTIKRTIKTIFLTLMLPVYALYRLLSLMGNTDGVFMSFSQALSLIPGKIGIYIRAAFYRLACTDTSDDISVGFLTILSHADTTIERGVYIGPQCNIGKCTIKQETLLGSGVHILSGKNQHNFDDVARTIQSQSGTFAKVTIGEDCWIGNGAIVMDTIAKKSIVAAGSVVHKQVAELSIVAGNPATLIKKRG